MKEEYRPYNRIGYLSPFSLLEIANDGLDMYLSLESKSDELKKKGTFIHDHATYYKEQGSIIELEAKILKETIKAVIFLGAFLESYFFDYSATALGQGYTEKHIERIDLISKIVLIPKLVTGVEINPDLDFWAGLKHLIKWRNRIVHNKTKDFFEYMDSIKNYDPKPLFKEFDIVYFFKSVEKLFDELEKIDQEGLHKFKYSLWEKFQKQYKGS